MTDTVLVSILVALTLGALSYILGGDVLLASAVLAAGFVTAFGLVCLLCSLPAPRLGSRPERTA
jgi:heme A synthase